MIRLYPISVVEIYISSTNGLLNRNLVFPLLWLNAPKLNNGLSHRSKGRGQGYHSSRREQLLYGMKVDRLYHSGGVDIFGSSVFGISSFSVLFPLISHRSNIGWTGSDWDGYGTSPSLLTNVWTRIRIHVWAPRQRGENPEPYGHIDSNFVHVVKHDVESLTLPNVSHATSRAEQPHSPPISSRLINGSCLEGAGFPSH